MSKKSEKIKAHSLMPKIEIVSNTFWSEIPECSHCAPVKDYDSYSLGAKRLFLKPATAFHTEKREE